MGENIYFIVSISLYHFYMAVIGLLSRQFTIFCFLCNNNEPSIGRTSRKMTMKEPLGVERLLQCRETMVVNRSRCKHLVPNGLQVWQRCSLVDSEQIPCSFLFFHIDLSAGLPTPLLCLDCPSLLPSPIPRQDSQPSHPGQ